MFEREEIEISQMKCMKEFRESAEEFFRPCTSPNDAIRSRCRKCKKKIRETPIAILKNTIKKKEDNLSRVNPF
ncbi:hypothetical protein [Alteribacter keqinensis]|uniref:Uncharacterized protein n=1 Tax=Alteribacter keqinensis TaxID=2483800 RepID=A0A3M7TUQ6_9BACI|nr:hypothetical protein [Alteribacter keqinensis]RNA69193.1 hypothetical protein EBO34_04380 [Alteribacter keqinensis]